MELHPVYDEINLPTYLQQALSNYFCVIPALNDLPNPPKGIVYKKLYHLDKCSFVSKTVAESKMCGGLQLFRNLKLITSSDNFCDKHLGD